MAKKEAGSLGACPSCGANMDLVGRAHNCRPRAEPIVGLVLSSADMTKQLDKLEEENPTTGPGIVHPGHTPAELKRMTAQKKRSKPTDDRVQLNVMLDKNLMKELKIAAIEDEQSIESFVDMALRQELKARRA